MAATQRGTQVDEAALALSAQAEQDQEYKAIYKALETKKNQKNFPRDYPAQTASDIWPSLLLEPDMPGLVLYMGCLWVPD